MIALAAIVAAALTAAAQTPKPFPAPSSPAQPAPAKPAAPAGQQPAAPPPPPAAATTGETAPSEAVLGVPIYPSAQFIRSYDAGRGQRFYLFGTSSPYAEMVLYYRSALKQNGSELFDAPPTHQFEIGRFRAEAMAFPPSVTLKDYTWGGSPGYANPKRGGQPERFATVIQIVAAPTGTPRQ